MSQCHIEISHVLFCVHKKSTYINRSLGYVLCAPCSISKGKLGLLPEGFAEALGPMMPQNVHPSPVHSQNREFDIKSTGTGPGTNSISIII